MAALLPYRYPTTVLFVDDDRVFLQSLSVGLDDNLAAAIFDSPFKALDFIARQAAAPRLHEALLAGRRGQPDGIEPALSDRLVTIELSKIAAAVYDPSRFEEVSVVVVDYAMPGLNGLEFCERIASRAVHKILLTGKADEKTAVEAFNRGIIDRFIVKSDPAALELVNSNIAALETRHFADISETIMGTLGSQAPGFLHDAGFAALFDEIRRRRGVVEYYLAGDCGGFLMLDAEGRCGLLRVLDDQDMRGQWEIARDQDAPSELLEALASRCMVPYFWQSEGFYSPGLDDWRAYLHPAEMLEGETRYYYAVVDDPPEIDGGRVYAYERYLEAIHASLND